MPGVNDQVIDSVTATNFKVLGESPAKYESLAHANAVSHQNRLNIMAEAAVGRMIKNLTEVDPVESVSVLKTISGNEVAGTIASLLAALSSGQQQVKVAQTTPPVTGAARQ